MSGITANDILGIWNCDGYTGIQTAVETGTFEGRTTRLLRQQFNRVVTIELQPDRWERCSLELVHDGVACLLGDSSHIIPLLAEAFRDRPVFWFLDAHWFDRAYGADGEFGMRVADSNPLPLWGELSAIVSRKQADIVVVDDVHAFGRVDIGTDVWGNVSTESIGSVLSPRLGSWKIVGDCYVAYLKEWKP